MFILSFFIYGCVPTKDLNAHKSMIDNKIAILQNEISGNKQKIENTTSDLYYQLNALSRIIDDLKNDNSKFKNETQNIVDYNEKKIKEMEDRVREMRFLLMNLDQGE